jgi:uncharacterized membrane protein (DUF2068 family)
LAESHSHRLSLRKIPADPANDGFLRIVAVFKFCKATLLLITAWGILKFLNPQFGARADTWIESLRSGLGQHVMRQVLETVNRLSPVRLHLLSFVSVVYATLFLVEGYGLWRGRRWAEYLTVVITSLLIPFEIYEVMTRGRWSAVAVLVLNVVIVVYLLRRVGVEWSARKTGADDAGGS